MRTELTRQTVDCISEVNLTITSFIPKSRISFALRRRRDQSIAGTEWGFGRLFT